MMSHEMTQNDSAVYYKEKAWHGLGNVVDYTLSLNSALRESGLGWGVEKTNGISANGFWTPDYRAVVRTDTQEILSVVSPRYQVVENEEVFRLAECFSDVATVESAGSIQGGRKCYLLLHADTFEATANDHVNRYMALIWGHDGKQSLIVKPTSVRVVCKNTMDMVLSQDTKNQITIKHHGDVVEKFEEARRIIGEFKNTGLLYKNQVQELGRKTISHDQLRRFFTDVYQVLRGPINVNPVKTEEEEAAYVTATETIACWDQTFETETSDLNASPWLAVNAVTQWIQHREPKRGRKASVDSKAYSSIAGKNALESKKVMQHALAMF
jgi:phage/plasmid-like protein (TIGR03299 family)